LHRARLFFCPLFPREPSAASCRARLKGKAKPASDQTALQGLMLLPRPQIKACPGAAMCEAALLHKSPGYLEAAHGCNLFHLESKKAQAASKSRKCSRPIPLFLPLSFRTGITNAKARAVKRRNAASSQPTLRAAKLLLAGTDRGTSLKHGLACWDHQQLFSPRFLQILELSNRRAWLHS